MWQCLCVCQSLTYKSYMQHYAIFLLQKDYKYIKWENKVSLCSRVNAMLYDVCFLMQCLGVDAYFWWLCNVRVDAMFGCWFIVYMLMHCSDDFVIFGCWCNFRVLMHCSGVYAMFGCWCNVQVLMQCSGFDAKFGCYCNVWVLMQFLAFDAMFLCWGL